MRTRHCRGQSLTKIWPWTEPVASHVKYQATPRRNPDALLLGKNAETQDTLDKLYGFYIMHIDFVGYSVSSSATLTLKRENYLQAKVAESLLLARGPRNMR